MCKEGAHQNKEAPSAVHDKIKLSSPLLGDSSLLFGFCFLFL